MSFGILNILFHKQGSNTLNLKIIQRQKKNRKLTFPKQSQKSTNSPPFSNTIVWCCLQNKPFPKCMPKEIKLFCNRELLFFPSLPTFSLHSLVLVPAFHATHPQTLWHDDIYGAQSPLSYLPSIFLSFLLVLHMFPMLHAFRPFNELTCL